MKRVFLLTFLIYSSHTHADGFCEISEVFCQGGGGGSKGRSSTSPANPTNNSAYSNNPAHVNMNTAFGVEVIQYQSSGDYSLVSGSGRVGAGISSAKPDGTFFGNFAIEREDESLERIANKKKYPNNKQTFALAISPLRLLGKKRKKKDWFDISLGGILRYNEQTEKFMGGGGLNFTVGPLNLGAAQFNDDFYDKTEEVRHQYRVTTLAASLLIPYFAFGYTEIFTHTEHELQTTILSSSLFLGPLIFTYGSRWQESAYQRFLFSPEFPLEGVRRRFDFGGLQVALGNHFLLSLFYNYYLHKEISYGMTFYI